MKSYIVATPAQLGQVLKSARNASELSQAALGQQVNVLQKTVSALENNPAAVQTETVFKILSALNLELVLRRKPANEDTQDDW